MSARHVLALSVCALLPSAVWANAPQSATPNDDDKVVCSRSSEAVVGTHLRQKRICLTKREWKEVEAQTQRSMQKMRDKHMDPGAQGTDR